MEYSPTEHGLGKSTSDDQRQMEINCYLTYFINFLSYIVYPQIATSINSDLRHGQTVGQLISMAKQVDKYTGYLLNHNLFHGDQTIMCVGIFKDT